MKKLLLLGLALVFAFGIGINSIAADSNDVQKLMSLMKSGEVKLWGNSDRAKVMHIYENTGNHNNFETTFKKHYALIEKHPGGETFKLIVRDYQNYYTIHDARGFILIILADYDRDGKVDQWRKDYVILLDDHFILIPHYPSGLINTDWYKMSREEAQKIFDEELKYMLEHKNEAKDGYTVDQ